MTDDGRRGDRPPVVEAVGSTSRSLLEHAKSRDPSAWKRLVVLYAPLVATWCRRFGIPEQDVVDVLQDVFASVSKDLGRFRKERPSDTFRGWLFTIARNHSTDRLRRRGREPSAAGGTEAFVRLNEAPDRRGAPALDAVEDAAFDEVLRRALDSIRGEFAETTWRAFWGVVVDGRSAADVGADLGMRPGTVRVAKSRVLLRLRRELGDVGE